MEIKCPFSLKRNLCGQAEFCHPIIVSLMCQNKVLFEHVGLSHRASAVKGRFETCLVLQQPRVFLHHELIVYFIKHFFGLCLSAAVKQAGHLSKPLFPGEKSCHLCMCHFCLAALSHLLAHFARAGEICATCHCLPVWQWD